MEEIKKKQEENISDDTINTDDITTFKNDVESVTSNTSPESDSETMNEEEETISEEEAISEEKTTIMDASSSFESFDFSSSSYESDNKNNSNYHLTVLMAFFFGQLGIHRLINGKVISGVLMLVLTLVTSLPLAIFLIVAANSIGDGSILLIITFFVLFIVALAVPIWKLVDLIMIMAGKFKNGKTGEYVKSEKSFFKTWSNILVLVLIVLSMIFGMIGAVVASININFTDNTLEEIYPDDEDDEDNENNGILDIDDYLQELESCVLESGDYTYEGFEVEDTREFGDALEDYFEYNNYIMDTYLNTMYFTRIDGDITHEFIISLEGDTEVEGCTSTTSYSEYNGDDFTFGMVEYDAYYGYDMISVYFNVSNDDSEITVSGEYNIENGTYDLLTYEGFNFDSEEKYDENIDEYGIIDIADELVGMYLDEHNVIFDK
ncbi:MAG: NINE protein [Bacilli bacterium]